MQADARYAETIGRMNRINGVGFGIVMLMSIVTMWGNWRDEAVYIVTFGLLSIFNTTINFQVARGRKQLEWLRCAVNSTSIPFICHLAHWPQPMWMVVPLCALVFDDFNRRVALTSLITLTIGVAAMSLYDGLPWARPAAPLIFGLLAWRINLVRFANIREMLAREEEQRLSLEREVSARERAELELRQAQKLEAVGRLAAGVAHEINTPIQFVTNSLQFIDSSSHELLELIDRCRPLVPADRQADLEAIYGEADLAYLQKNVPEALDHATVGLQRVAAIVRSMKQFAHPDQTEKVAIDFNQAISDTLTISRHEYKLIADIETDYGVIPEVVCHPGEVNQVFLNLVVNASQAIFDQVTDSGRRGRISITTRCANNQVTVSIADTGGGIPEEVRSKIFEPFFTTKPVGQGTGQGLAIARSVAERHGGRLEFESTVGVGTTFRLTMPVTPVARAAVAASSPPRESSAGLSARTESAAA